MPRARNAIFEIGGQWIGRAHGRKHFYRHWTDAGTGITRRESLGTADLEAARRRLAEIVITAAPKTADSLMSAVLLDYFTSRTDHLPSKKQSRNAGRVMLKCWGTGIRIGALNDAKQREFAEWCLDQGFALSYAARNLTVLKAALNHAGITPAARIICAESKMRERWGLSGRSAERAYIPSDDELASFFRCEMPESLQRWAVLMLLTACRPSAAVDLAPDARHRSTRLIDINPRGRAQNKKFRPLLRVPRALAAFLDRWEVEGLDNFGGHYSGYTTIEGVKSALDRVLKKHPELPPLSTYSFRHKPASVLRQARVPEDQIALQLGHRRRDLRMTSGYGEFDPDYLADAARALDAWFLRLRRSVKTHAIRTAAESVNRRAA